MRKKILAGNWKMNGRKASIKQLLSDISGLSTASMDRYEMLLLPPAIYLPYVADFLSHSPIKWGAQNVYPAEAGAFTGELCAPMLKDYLCAYVLVGHSERRNLFHESEKFIAEKFHHVKEHDMIPLLCVGETEAARAAGHTKAVLREQLEAVAAKADDAFNNCVIAYEPVWAIGTGKTALPEMIQEAHATIRALITELGNIDGQKVTILYGGSVNENNAASIFALSEVDGGLIGGASLDARKFLEIAACIN